MSNLNPAATMTDIMATLRPADPPRPRAARIVTTTTPDDEPTREETVPTGVYDRSKAAKRGEKKDAPPPVTKQRRKRHVNGTGDSVAALAQESLIAAGKLLRAAVEENVTLEPGNGDGVLKGAIANYDRAEKLAEAVKA